MSRPVERVAIAALALLAMAATADAGERYHLGRAAPPAEIAAWDIDVRPDGQGLPPGQGTAANGEAVYEEHCARCHGDFGEGAGRFPALMGGAGTLTAARPLKTIGSYWPYATTVWDYVYRAMPFGDAQSLSADETYAVTAYLLYLNDLVDEDFVVDRASLPAIEMPNRTGFVPDPRPDTPSAAPCMRDCKTEVRIETRATARDVTPETETKGAE